MQVVLVLEVVGPPKGHHRDTEPVGDAHQRVARTHPVRTQERAAVLDRGLRREAGDQRAVGEEGARDVRARGRDQRLRGIHGGDAAVRDAIDRLWQEGPEAQLMTGFRVELGVFAGRPAQPVGAIAGRAIDPEAATDRDAHIGAITEGAPGRRDRAGRHV